MTTERLGIMDIHELFRLSFREGKTLRQTAQSLNISPSTVHGYLCRAKLAELVTWEAVCALDEQELTARLFPPPVRTTAVISKSKKHLQPKWEEIHLEMKKPGVTLELLWQEYRQEQPDGLGRSQFNEYYRIFRKKISVVMRQTYVGGKWSFVDYSGKKFPIIDRLTGEPWWAELFVGVLEPVRTHLLRRQFPKSCRAGYPVMSICMRYFGGVPGLTVPDNLKSGVNKACRYDPESNRSYQEFAEHYGTCIFPTRAYRPRDKAKVEAGVLVAQRWIIAVLRNRRLYSLAEANEAIRQECLPKLNNRVMRHIGKSRKEMWEIYDKPNLKPLPVSRYEFATWKKVGVNIDYHVEVDRHYYSVPFKLANESVWIRATLNTVEVFHKGKRVASHVRSCLQYKATTEHEHMPESHRQHAEWTPSRIIHWAAKTGPSCSLLVSKILELKKYPELGYRSALGVIRLGTRFGTDRLEKACAKALSIESPAYRTVKSMLKNRAEETEVENPHPMPFTPENLRGPGYYH